MSMLSKKLDSRAQIQLAVGELPDDLELMLRLDKDLTDDERQSLESAGCAVRSAKGKVVVGKSKRSALEQIAEQAFVQQIEVSRALHPEEPSRFPEPDVHEG